MADVRAVKSGNWSDTTVWNTGALPTSADDVYANNFTVTVDVSPTVLSIRNTSATGISAGGQFQVTATTILTCTGTGILSGSTTPPLSITVNSPNTVTINSNISGGSTLAWYACLINSGTGTININGNLTMGGGGGGGNADAIRVGSNVTLNVNGNITGVTAGNTLRLDGSGCSVTVTGNLLHSGGGAFGTALANNGNNSVTITGGSLSMTATNGTCINNASSGTINITSSSLNGPSSSSGNLIINSSTGTVNVTGNVVGGSAQPALLNSGTGTLNVTGSITGGSGSNGTGVTNSSGTFFHIGTLQSSTSAPAVGTGNATQTTTLTGPFLTNVNGVNPVTAARWFWQNTTPPATYYQIRSANLATIRPLYTADSVGGNPAITNVRSGTVYGPNSELTGTCAVPPAGSVALGVPVDNTTGTAVLTQANFQAALDAQGLTSARATKLDSLDAAVSSRLATSGYTAPPTSVQNAQAVRTELSTEMGRIDTTVSSRLATTGYTAPLDAAGTRTALGLATNNLDAQLDSLPTAVENASAVRTELSTELGRIDVATSTRSTFNPATEAVAQVTLVDTTTNLTNPPDVPTTSEIAEAVRIELAPELSHLDADVTSRLASVDYTIPPTPEQNAQAVEVQLALPLGNLDVAVSTRSTFNPATDTVAQVALVDVTTDLTNPPVVPTPEQIATAVRTELEPELERIDADVSSRLAATDYEQAPTAEQNAEAVRTELTPELERLSNCATVATTGQQIQNALSI